MLTTFGCKVRPNRRCQSQRAPREDRRGLRTPVLRPTRQCHAQASLPQMSIALKEWAVTLQALSEGRQQVCPVTALSPTPEQEL